MRRLVVCCDGTWKTYSDDTNVARLHRHLAETDAQVVRYFPGSGTQGTPWGRVLEAGFGTGLAEDVQGVYAWLAATWRPGDEVVLFGFSRGAFTVRSLTGMLTSCGLAQPADPTDDAETAALAERVWREGYRGGRPVTDVVFHPAFGPDDRAPIAFLGVWDTVGALGVPVTFGFLSALFGRGDVRFRDVVLSPDVRHARQALALDEQRGPFVPAVWPDPSPGTHDSLVQLWFPGGHGDVGGGRPETGLSDAALRWMADEADATVGLTWQDPVTVTGDPTVTVEDGPDGLWRYLSPRPRTVPRVVEGAPAVHPTAVARRAAGLAPPYRPGVVPAPGETHRFDVPADDPWHESGLWLEPGRYRVAVEGTWRDHGASVPATGARSWPSWPLLSWPAWGLGAALDEVRALARRVTGNARADSLGSRRVADAPWMALVVAVANDRRELDGTLHEGTSLAIDADAESDLDLATAGYLYAFANDAWTGYGSNDGFVSCIITCVSWGFTPTQS